MRIEDLKWMFQHQLRDGKTNLELVIVEGEKTFVVTYNPEKLDKLLIDLGNFIYLGNKGDVPMFEQF